MLNRVIQVKLVKPKKKVEEVPETSESYFEDKAEFISNKIDGTMKKIGMFAIGYVVIDTFRQVMVAKANRG